MTVAELNMLESLIDNKSDLVSDERDVIRAAVEALKTLPVTDDGVIVTPRMTLYAPGGDRATAAVYVAGGPEYEGTPYHVSRCFADRANAEKARGG